MSASYYLLGIVIGAIIVISHYEADGFVWPGRPLSILLVLAGEYLVVKIDEKYMSWMRNSNGQSGGY